MVTGQVVTDEMTGQDDFHSEPHYSFGYKIENPSTGDSKSQYEIRDGDTVQGNLKLKLRMYLRTNTIPISLWTVFVVNKHFLPNR